MTDPVEQSPAASAASPEPAPASATPEPVASETIAAARDRLAWLCGAGFIVLAGALAWLWLSPPAPAPALPLAQLDALGLRISALETRISRLEQRPAAAPVDLASLAARLSGIEQTQAAANAEIAQLTARLSKAEQQSAAAPADLNAMNARVASLERTASQVGVLAQRADRIARIQAAQVALELGQPLGDIPSAPPALGRYAASNPPTEASLRLAFPAVARLALAASRPDTEGRSFWQRAWGEAQSLVTIRDGDKVIVGDPAAGVLARAQGQLDVGDLARAAATVATLSGPAAQAMSAWLGDARGLLDARAALAALAAHA
jgi:hypothetical protein